MQVGYKLFYIFSFHSFRILDINFKKIFFISISIVVFFEIFIKLGCIFKPSTDTFYDRAHPYKLFRSQYFRCDGSFFIIIFHEFVIRFWVLMNGVTYCTSNAYQYQLVDWISLWSFLWLFAMLNLVQKKNEQYQVHIFQDTYSENCWIL